MLDIVMTTPFEHVQQAGNIGIDVDMGICQRIANTGECGEVDHPRGTLPPEQIGNSVAIGEIGLSEPEPREGVEARQAVFLQPDVVGIIQVIKPDDLPSQLQQAERKVRPDEARRSGHQYPVHASGFPLSHFDSIVAEPIL
jgi:hypothetical protein